MATYGGERAPGTCGAWLASNMTMAAPKLSMESLSDADLAGRVAARDPAAFEALMRRYNARLYRVARAILRDDGEAEDALQEAYLAAYAKIDGFRAEATLSTWLTRIVINEALGRLRRRKRGDVVVPFSGDEKTEHEEGAIVPDDPLHSPEMATLRGELRGLLERRIDALPLAFRTVFMLREVEEMTVEEVARSLDIPEATVRTRLFRARALLRDALSRDLDSVTLDVFAFDGDRCDRIVVGVLARLGSASF
jgi:RNA polymerase sigma-70 factor, ECF subfamily